MKFKGLKTQVKNSYIFVYPMAKNENEMTFLWKIVRLKMYCTSNKN